MDPITQQQALATAGAAGGEALYVDDVFSTYLWEGDGGYNLTPAAATVTVDNDIDLSGEGGLVWLKNRDAAYDNWLFDTERGGQYALKSNSTAAQQDGSSTNKDVTFNSTGFVIGEDDSGGGLNRRGESHVSWTFRKAPGFFDVVTYTGTGSAQTISHNLGSVPGMIWVKSTSNSTSWIVYHRSLNSGEVLELDGTNAAVSRSDFFGTPTSTTFAVGNSNNTSASGHTYVAYIFAHDDQSFGENGDQSIIKCGSYTGNGSAQGQEIDVGFEPQWILLKVADGDTGNWYQYDTMRGWTVNDSDNANHLRPNLTNGENDSDPSGGLKIVPTSTGFRLPDTDHNQYPKVYIYMAIRRPHKPPSAATDVFSPHASRSATDTTPSELAFTANFPVDLLFYTNRIGGTNSHSIVDRMRGGNDLLATASTSAEVTTNHKFDSNEGVYLGSTLAATSNYGGLLFRRAPSFFDIVAYEGNATAGRTVNHNLGVKPELMIVKRRDVSSAWRAYNTFEGATKYLIFNTSHGGVTNTTAWNDTEPTATQFTVGTSPETNGSGNDLIAYLFASLDGISKVGNYTGTGSNIDVDCGFTSGARFVLIKRYGASGDWFVYDSARGIVTGNDPYVVTNTSAAEVTNTDYIDPLNAGFTVTSTASSTINVSGGTYLYLAIA